MGFINHNKVIVSPIDKRKVIAIRLSVSSVQIGMEKNIITKPVICDRVVFIISFVNIPVVCKFFRTKHQNPIIAAFKIFNHRKCRECFSKTNAVGKNTAVVLFKFIDYRKAGILLEVIKFFPDCTLLESC